MKRLPPLLLLIPLLILAACEPNTIPSPMALATPIKSTVTLSTPGQVYDCFGGLIGGFKVKANGVTVQNCTIIAAQEYAIEVRGNDFTLLNSTIKNNYGEGSGIDIQNADGSCSQNLLVDNNVDFIGDMGWGITGRLCHFDIHANFTGIGKAGGSGKHGLYINNWKNGTIEATFTDIYNSGIKIIGIVNNITFRNVTCRDIGTSRVYGSCVMLGEGGDLGRQSTIGDLIFENLSVINAYDGAISVDDDRKPMTNICVNGTCYAALKSIKVLPTAPTLTPAAPKTATPTMTITATVPATITLTRVPTSTSTPTASRTPTPSRTPTRTPTLTPSPVPTICEFSKSFMICTIP